MSTSTNSSSSNITRLENERADAIASFKTFVQRVNLPSEKVLGCIKKINADFDHRIHAIKGTRQPGDAEVADEEEEKVTPERPSESSIPSSRPSKRPRVFEEEEEEDDDDDSESVEWSSTNTDQGDQGEHKIKAISSGSSDDSGDNEAKIVDSLQDCDIELANDQAGGSSDTGRTETLEGTEEDEDYGTADDYDFDLQQSPDPDIEKQKIRKSKLSMAMQGFRQAKRAKKHSCDTEEEPMERRKAGAFDPSEVRHNGTIFIKGMVYRYTEKDINVIVGIKQFVSKKKAMCVLIVPFEDTFLGLAEETDVDNDVVVDFDPSSHYQVHDHVSTLKLKHFGGRVPGIDGIPVWVYEPQTVGKWNRFGYFLDKSRRLRRKGRREHMRALELFSGAGGMHLGLKNAGFTTVGAVDNDKFACATMRMNSSDTPIFQEDVTSFLERHKNDLESRELLGPVDVLPTTPPCQGFSSRNRNGGKNDKRNNALSLTVLDGVRLFRPTAVIFENVLGMWRRKHVHYLKSIVRGLLGLGYQVRVAELRACDYGSAQIRPRVIIFATHRSAPPPKFPPRTHGSEEEGLLPFVTAGDALCGLDDGMDSVGNPLRNLNYATTTRDDAVKLQENGLAPAICVSSTPPLHYRHDRCISVRECATLQDFPSTYRISGSFLKDQYKQIGNAVPVELATKLAQAVREILVFEYEEN